MATAERIKPKTASQRMDEGDALLVCAYDSDEKFEENHLYGAIARSELNDKLDEIDQSRELIFY